MVGELPAVVGQTSVVGDQILADGALDEVPNHQAEAVDEAEGTDAVRSLEKDRVEAHAGLQPGEAVFVVILAFIALDHVFVGDGPAVVAGADEDEAGGILQTFGPNPQL